MLTKLATLAGLLLLLPAAQPGRPPGCRWRPATEIGRVASPINEDSGLAASRRFRNRLYHVNDSGDSGRFFVTDYSGDRVRTVAVAGFTPIDVEDVSIGACSDALDCLFIADIGDNDAKRSSIEVVIVEERERFPDEVAARHRVAMRYPHGPRDAEALAVHPDGSIYILTKRDRPPQLFRLTKDQWMRADGRIQTLERVAAIDLMKLGADNANQGAQPTALDIWRDGTKALVLTYREAFELFVDFSKPIPPVDVWKSGREYRKIDIVALRQQEGLSYAGNDRTLVYDSELASEPTAPIMRSVCR